MRHHAIASPSFAAHHVAQGMDAAALATAPMIVFNRKDDLQARLVRRCGRTRDGRVPGPGGLAGTGTAGGAHRAARTESLAGCALYWHHAAVRSSTFQHITDAIRPTTARRLRQRA
jgi:LysR family transcriptional regulator (chromosome initiation inhibitor)